MRFWTLFIGGLVACISIMMLQLKPDHRKRHAEDRTRTSAQDLRRPDPKTEGGLPTTTADGFYISADGVYHPMKIPAASLPYATNAAMSPQVIPAPLHGQGPNPKVTCFSEPIRQGRPRGKEVPCGYVTDPDGNVKVYWSFQGAGSIVVEEGREWMYGTRTN